MAYKRNFKGVWIPKDVWLNNNLTLQEKVFLVEIDSLDNSEDKGCFAGNQHFADFFGISKSRVSEVIKTLVDKKLIKRKILKTQTGSIRYLKVSHPLKTVSAHHQDIEVRTSEKRDSHNAKTLTRIIQSNNTSFIKEKKEKLRGKIIGNYEK